MKLAELQRAFQSRILHAAHGIEPWVSGAKALDSESRLGIYENAFLARLVEALADTYPAVRAALGEAGFVELTRAFVATTPPSHFSIRYFGRELASFIATQGSGVRAAALSDLARWEWALTEAFDAADAVALTQADLAHIEPGQWGRLQLHLSPSLRRLRIRSNAIQWWRAGTQDMRRPARWQSAKPVEWALWRSQLTPYFRSLPRDEAWAIDAAQRGQPFASICAGLAAFHDGADAPMRAAILLRSWLSDGWIVGVDLQ